MIRKTTCSAVALLVLLGATPAFATNGMNLEGYGSKSLAMGGTGSAYDTGNSAAMNNPATLGFMKEGEAEIGFGIRALHPDVDVTFGGNKEDSVANAFYMPSLSYMRRDGRISWGAAMFAQGGMGTDFGKNSLIFSGMSGEDIRSEVGVARLMFPVAYHLTNDTTVGASFDVVMASMDLQMDMDGTHLGGMMAGNGGSVSGSLLGALSSFTNVHYARFDFSNNSPWIGEAIGFGTGLKFGITQKVSKSLTIGASYHSQTKLNDLETSNATISFAGDTLGGPYTQKLTGKIKVRDFEWPATAALGFAYQASDKLMIASDVKFIDWSSVMDKFSMTFIADDSNPGFAGQNLDVTMKQNWKDQTVWSVGMQYMATKKLALRAGASFSTNPIPDQYLNPLFPAITKNHYTCGFGYRLTDKSSVAAALSLVPKVTTTNGDGVDNAHSQVNWSMNYTHSL
ncbi:MAG: aromatic hydrocarbon degradation protein [Chlorobaculum sp.]|nr:aromatic hydrocarbon degradation protein [Chlorobaculum sp.]